MKNIDEKKIKFKLIMKKVKATYEIERKRERARKQI